MTPGGVPSRCPLFVCSSAIHLCCTVACNALCSPGNRPSSELEFAPCRAIAFLNTRNLSQLLVYFCKAL